MTDLTDKIERVTGPSLCPGAGTSKINGLEMPEGLRANAARK
jgi:hypothetical protein